MKGVRATTAPAKRPGVVGPAHFAFGGRPLKPSEVISMVVSRCPPAPTVWEQLLEGVTLCPNQRYEAHDPVPTRRELSELCTRLSWDMVAAVNQGRQPPLYRQMDRVPWIVALGHIAWGCTQHGQRRRIAATFIPLWRVAPYVFNVEPGELVFPTLDARCLLVQGCTPGDRFAWAAAVLFRPGDTFVTTYNAPADEVASLPRGTTLWVLDQHARILRASTTRSVSAQGVCGGAIRALKGQDRRSD